ncbi:MAG TPA: threonine/serine exporter family protein [Micromonosporaceae bacterium]|nr:threonine/serine exporter family protein [Micromonosporaceae bacterium]
MSVGPARDAEARGLHAFLLEVGRSLSLAGAAVNETQERLTRIAAANGAPDARIVVLPTALMLATGPAHRATIESVPSLAGALRLDQISVLYELVKDAERGRLGPEDGLARLRAVREMRPRFGRTVTLAGHTAMTVGLCLILQPTPLDVAIAAALGAIVGALLLITGGRPTVGVFVPVLAALIISAISFTAVAHGVADPGLRTLIAPLITFLPGGVLTTATVELASGEMVAGASRLVYGGLQLLLLAFGIVAGVGLADLPREVVLNDAEANTLGWWAPWLGVLVFGVAVNYYFSAPRGTLRWLLPVLLVAWCAQLAGEAVVGAAASGFVGALAMTPVSLAVARLPGGPPSQVTFLPAFWLLVPGAVGLLSLTEVVSDPASAGLEDFIEPVASIVSIALGVLCGASAYRWFVPRRFR